MNKSDTLQSLQSPQLSLKMNHEIVKEGDEKGPEKVDENKNTFFELNSFVNMDRIRSLNSDISVIKVFIKLFGI